MIKQILLSFVLLFSAQVFAQQTTGDEIPLIPMEDFFRNPEKRSFQISPDGKHLAFMQPWQNRMNVHIQKIGEEEAVRVTHATERDIAGYFWKGNDRIVYVQDTKGDENFRLFAVDKNDENQKDLTPFDSVRAGIVDDLKEVPGEMLIQLNKRNARIFDVYRIDITTGEMKLIAENPGNITGWVTDHDGKLRIALTTDGVNAGILYRDTEEDQFEEKISTNFRETLYPVFFTFDNKDVYMISNLGRDKAAIVKYDIKNNKELELIYEHPEVDVSSLYYSEKRKVLVGVGFTTWKREYEIFDEASKEIYDDLQNKLPGIEVVVTSENKEEDKLLVRTYSDRSLGAYYLYDVNDKKLTHIIDVGSWLNEDFMAEMKPITYKSRDGLTINGYLTLPLGVEAKNLPVVVHPHGGPWARDGWGFNPIVQFLANRGYAVLQMNFRGSTGYGKEFWETSFKKWGKEMQDDITDGVQWLIDEDIADKDRIGIFGGSYGGYATLAGLTFTPDLYACGVDYVGVSSIFSWMNAIPPYWEPYREMIYEMVGHPQADSLLLYDASPLFHADKIKAPLFIAQGANDPRVPQAESDQMVEVLKQRGIDVPYMVKEDEGHGFRNEENRFDFYGAMEQFFFKHLGGRATELIEEKN